jgi:hypothetical protein
MKLATIFLVCGPLVGVDCGDQQLTALMHYREQGKFGEVEKICKAYRRLAKGSGPDQRFERECGQIPGKERP